jgi:hypothetical protein
MIDKAKADFYHEDESQRDGIDDCGLFDEPKGTPSRGVSHGAGFY